MSLKTKALLLMIAGGASGALTWILTEVLRSPADTGVTAHAPWQACLLSVLIGLAAAIVEAAVSDNAAQRHAALQFVATK